MSPVFTGLNPLFRSSSPLYGRAGLKWPIRPLLYGTGISQMRKKRNASRAYWEQVGVNRQAGGVNGLTHT